MQTQIFRPLPSGHEKVNYYDHLELRYLRWDYLVKAANPKDSLLRKKERVIKYAARKAYYKHIYEFNFMKMGLEDVESIARVYAVSYLGLYSLEKNPTKKDVFKKKFKDTNQKDANLDDVETKDNKQLLSFIEQRFLECSYILRQYCKGEPGFVYYTVFSRTEGNQWPTDEELLSSPKKYGWTKVPWSKFLKIREMFNNVVTPGFSIEIEGILYRVAVPNTSLANIDKDPVKFYKKLKNYHPSPEDEIIENEEGKTKKVTVKGVTFDVSLNERLSCLVDLYKERSLEKKLKILNLFMGWMKRRNGSQKELQSEIDQVKSMIYSLKKQIQNGKHNEEASR